ncbi:MAG: mechanosensitive ion channel family protein [Actinomycetota bacterium]
MTPPRSPASLLAQEDGDTLTTSATEGLADLINRVVPAPFEFIVVRLVSPGLTILLILLLAVVLNALSARGIRRATERMKQEGSVGGRLHERLSGQEEPSAVQAQRRVQRAEALGAVIRSVTTVTIWVVAAIMALGQFGINLGPLIAGAGILGVALGFGAQELVKDFLSGVFMLVEDQYGVGDIIDASGAVGVVEGISLRSTRIRALDGTLWHVPNGEIRQVGNMSHEFARAMLDVSVAYGTDIDAAADLIERVAVEMAQEQEYREVFLEPPEVLGVELLGDDAIDLRLLIKTQPAKQWSVSRELRRRIKNAFDAAGVEIPFPQRTVWLRTERATAFGDADTEPFELPVLDEAAKLRAVEASTYGDQGRRDEVADMLPDESVEVEHDEERG